MPIYFHSCLCSYLSRVPILVEGTVYICNFGMLNWYTYTGIPLNWYTYTGIHILVYLKSAKFEQLILCGSSAKVQLKTYWSICDCAKVELLQVYFRYTLNSLHLKTDIYIYAFSRRF